MEDAMRDLAVALDYGSVFLTSLRSSIAGCCLEK